MFYTCILKYIILYQFVYENKCMRSYYLVFKKHCCRLDLNWSFVHVNNRPIRPISLVLFFPLSLISINLNKCKINKPLK